MTDQQGNGQRTVGPREGAAAGVIALGVLAIVMPGAVMSIVDPAQASLALWGMNVLLGVFIIAAGVMVLRARD